MKSTIGNEVIPEGSIIYPCLMQSTREKKRVVLFREPKRGTTVSNDPIYGMGTYLESWSMDYFEPFNGTITLEN